MAGSGPADVGSNPTGATIIFRGDNMAIDITSLKLIKKGKVKEVYEVDNDKFLFHFTNNISVLIK